MTTKLDDISEAIGQLRAEVRNLGNTLTESNRRADEHRASIHKRVDELVDEVGEVKSTVNVLSAKVAIIDTTAKQAKEVTDKVEMWEQRGVGALFTAGIAGTALGGTAVAFLVYWWDAIMKLLRSVAP
jgi:uncharacterized protein YoxC